MDSYKILIVADFDKKFFNKIAKYGEIIKANNLNNLQLKDVNILVVRSKTKVDRELVNNMKNLKCVVSATHGTDHVSLDYLKEKGIEFYNVPAQSYDVAQGVIAYILAYSTNLVDGNKSMKSGEWRKKQLRGFRIKSKTLGIIGYGNIGKEVAKMAKALEMNVVIYDPYIKNINNIVSLDELLEISDFITIHIPLNEETEDMIGRHEINKMKDGAYLINTARGGIVNERALLDALCTGKLGGAALDVFYHQPPFNDEVSDRLTKNQRVIATPHSIGQTKEAIDQKGDGVINAIKDYIKRQSLKNTGK